MRLSMTLTVHIQITLLAPRCRNTSTMCRHAATNTFGDVCLFPHPYQLPFIS